MIRPSLSVPDLMTRPLPRLLEVLALLAAFLTVSVVNAPEARADGCYTWGRTLSQGASGEDVRQLQIRVAGYPGYGGHPRHRRRVRPRHQGRRAAVPVGVRPSVRRHRRARDVQQDLRAAGRRLHADPLHLLELDDGCGGSGWDGGPLSPAQTKANALQTMWQLEAMRHALGDVPLNITSGFRSIACNNAVGGASNSQHLYGRSADLVGSPSLCTLAQRARYHGFGGIFGPGYPGHNDHTHVDIRTSNSWSAPNCGIDPCGCVRITSAYGAGFFGRNAVASRSWPTRRSRWAADRPVARATVTSSPGCRRPPASRPDRLPAPRRTDGTPQAPACRCPGPQRCGRCRPGRPVRSPPAWRSAASAAVGQHPGHGRCRGQAPVRHGRCRKPASCLVPAEEDRERRVELVVASGGVPSSSVTQPRTAAVADPVWSNKVSSRSNPTASNVRVTPGSSHHRSCVHESPRIDPILGDS